jgi:adenylate cyclase
MADHAERALSAAQSMIKAIDKLNRELVDAGKPSISVGIGLDTGMVVAGHVGSERRLEFTLIGVPVNNSSYLSKVRPAKVLMSETTRGSLPIGIDVIDHEPLLLKGANEPQLIYQLQISVGLED